MTLQKTELFMPLTAEITAEEKNREFRVTVIPRETAAPPFQTLSQVASSAAGLNESLHKTNCEPRLTVQRDGERITNIRIQCSCGQIMELACVYDEAVKAK